MSTDNQIFGCGQGMLRGRMQARQDVSLRTKSSVAFWGAGLLTLALVQFGSIGIKLAWDRFWLITALIAVSALFGGAVLPRLSGRKFAVGEHCMVFAGWIVVTFIVASSGGPQSPHNVFFALAMIYAAYFLTPRAATLHIAFGTLCALVPLAYDSGGAELSDVQALIVELVIFAAMSAMVMVRRRAMLKAERRVRWLSLSDPLTGAANLRAIEDAGEALVKQHLAEGTTFGLAVADLDGLKRVNTAFGHQGGDDLIKSCSECLMAASTPEDQVGRTGGDEFLVLMPGGSQQDLDAWTVRFASVVEGYNDAIAASRPQVSASGGTALFPHDGETLDDLRAVADVRMYERKSISNKRMSTLQSTETDGGRELRDVETTGRSEDKSEATALNVAVVGWLTVALALLMSVLVPHARVGEPAQILALSAFCGLIGLISFAGRFGLTHAAITCGKWASVFVVAPAALITGGPESPLVPAVMFMTAYAAYFLPEREAVFQISVMTAVFSVAFWASGGVSAVGQTLFFNVIAISLVVSAILQHNARQLAKTNASSIRLALNDPLTGIANRRAFEEDLDAMTKEAVRTSVDQRRPALIFIDVDDFKAVNTSLGHSGGDALLRSVASRLRDAIAHDGNVYRVGGDEFAVLASVRLAADAAAISERCRVAVHGAGRDVSMPVTASFGFAVWRESFDAHRLVIEADSALALSKDNGKDAVSASRTLKSVDSLTAQPAGGGSAPTIPMPAANYFYGDLSSL
ncbi:MAG: GGDEF domain-containing protein [Solirubrobacterales bacterium]